MRKFFKREKFFKKIYKDWFIILIMKPMKFAGIIGIVVVILSLILSVLTVVNKEFSFVLITSSAIMILLIFFYFGFVKMGESIKSKLIKISSWLVIISSVILIVLVIITFFWVKSSSSLPGPIGSLIAVTIFLSWGVSLFSILLSVGLITVWEKVKFARIAGILGIVLVIISGWVL